MDSVLKGLFGGGDGDTDDRGQRVRDFVDRYEQGDPAEGYSGDEALENYRRVTQHAPPEVMERAAEQAFGRMDSGQRQEFARMLQQRMGGTAGDLSDDPRQLAGTVRRYQEQNTGGLASLFGFGDDDDDRRTTQRSGGGGGGLGDLMSNPLAKVALGGIAAYTFKQILDRDDNEGGNRGKMSV